MIENGKKFLEKYVQDLLEGTEKVRISYDLWEMHEGVSIYSLASIFAAYQAMLNVYNALEETLDNRLKQENFTKQKVILQQQLEELKEYVVEKFYDEEKKSFVRNEKDRKLDISLLGLVVPFGMFSPNEKKITNTLERLNMNLRTYTGGYLRFEQDHYTEDRPWVIATLWKVLYDIQLGDFKSAKESFDFVIATATEHGFLAEQVDNNKMESVWVIGLAWSHAMFVIALEEFIKHGLI